MIENKTAETIKNVKNHRSVQVGLICNKKYVTNTEQLPQQSN